MSSILPPEILFCHPEFLAFIFNGLIENKSGMVGEAVVQSASNFNGLHFATHQIPPLFSMSNFLGLCHLFLTLTRTPTKEIG